MKNNITTLEINNFKSVKNLKLDCKRINVFIGEPNVGKSNILESLSLFSVTLFNSNKQALSNQIRFEKIGNLFFDQDRNQVVSVKTDIGIAMLRFQKGTHDNYEIILGPDHEFMSKFLDGQQNYEAYQLFTSNNATNSDIFSKPIKPFLIQLSGEHSSHTNSLRYTNPFRRYIFTANQKESNPFSGFLASPYGENLYSILEHNSKLYEECSRFFSKYGLDLLIDTQTNKLDVQKRVGNRVYKIPYSLAADTLQRIIFHFAAIETNDDSIIIFEEPEAHSFPKYISMFADKVIESKNNQFFIATHSPYLLTPFIEQCDPKDVAIFICTYENYETKARALTDKEIGNIMENGIDLFFNIPAFEK
ncbi:MAG: AAA family ATPase [Bacteroidetes bacterium]|nr:AAA family ATPase [Bacteroidota bacterium]